MEGGAFQPSNLGKGLPCGGDKGGAELAMFVDSHAEILYEEPIFFSDRNWMRV